MNVVGSVLASPHIKTRFDRRRHLHDLQLLQHAPQQPSFHDFRNSEADTENPRLFNQVIRAAGMQRHAHCRAISFAYRFIRAGPTIPCLWCRQP